MPASFEMIYVTQGDDATPAVEIEFSGQRLCVIRLAAGGEFNICFVMDLKLGNDVTRKFPLTTFNAIVEEACTGLASWHANIIAAGHQTHLEP